jgi:hypothetical protein
LKQKSSTLTVIISIEIIKMTVIEVMVIMTDARGKEHTYWGGETGTPEFYTVKHTLEAYLGETVYISYHDENDTFVIENNDEGCDNSYDYIKIIESIYENAYSYECSKHLCFEILYVEW